MPQLDQGTNDEEPEVTSQAEKVLDNLKCSPLPQGWMYFETPKGLEYIRMNVLTMQMLNRLRVNKDLSVNVIFSNNEELTVNDNICFFNSISDFLKSVERWPLCVGTQIDEEKYSPACRGVLVGDDSYRRFQVNPRCKSCRSLRHRTLTTLAQKRRRLSILQKELKQQKRMVKMADDIDIEEHDMLDNPRIKTELIDNEEEGLDSGYKMADNIDIEKDMDNPRIKNIFPDITCIKTEVIKYEDEDVNDFDEESYETYQLDLTDPEKLECSVVPKDCGDSLKNNPCFCSNCEILFPTENALDSHKMTAHSFLESVGRNKAIKSTSKSSISSIAAILKSETDSNMEISNLCSHCNKVFPDEISFLKHSDELLTRKFSCDDCDVEFESEISLQRHLRTHPSVLMYCCPICFCYFNNKIVSHMIKQHQIDVKNVPEPAKTTFKCRFCAKIMKDNCSYNCHIRNSHPELFNKINHRFECQPCNLTFPSAYAEKRHRRSQHTTEAESHSKPLLPKIIQQVSQNAIESETSSTSIDLDTQVKIEPLSPKITHQVSQHAIKTYSKSVVLDKQIKIEPLSPTITHRVSQHAIKTYSKSVDLDKQIKIEPLSPTITHRVSQHVIESETSSTSIDLDKQVKIEPLSPTITHRVSQHAIKTYSKSVDLDKQIKIEPLSPTITHRVSQHVIESETSSTSIDLDKQVKIEPLSLTITQTEIKQELQ